MRQRQEAVQNALPDIWKSLRASVFVAVREYAKKYPQNEEPFDYLRTSPEDGFEEAYVEILDATTMPKSIVMNVGHKVKRRVQFAVNRSEATITVSYSGSNGIVPPKLIFKVDTNTDLSPCLVLGKEIVPIEVATEKILSQFLFPELPSNQDPRNFLTTR